MKDDVKAVHFRDLASLDMFQAQIDLEEAAQNSALSKILSLDVSQPNFELEYAKLRGAIDVLKDLKGKRERFIDQARSRPSS